MNIKFAHVSITARDLNRLAVFYMDALGCTPARAEKGFSGEWLEKGTGVSGADFRRVHLRMPGGGEDGPFLEIIEYSETQYDPTPPAANRTGLRHVAFETETPEELRERYDLVLESGGRKLGEITEREIEGLGTVTFVYMTDPEGNIVELVSWREENKATS